MSRTRRYVLIGIVLIVAVVLSGCAAPYKLGPGFYSRSGEIKKIGLFPLIYNEDGKEERLFGDTFGRVFYTDIMQVSLVPPVELEGRDALMAAFKDAGFVFADSSYVTEMSGIKFPRYSHPSTQALKAISGTYDAILVPTLLGYNEASAGTQMTQMCLSTCLTGGMVTVSENNFLRMSLNLVDTTSGEDLWIYTASYGGELGEQRVNYSEKVVTEFSKYFPFSTTFKG